MTNIDVQDLPEPVARAIAAMVETIRNQIAHDKSEGNDSHRIVALPSWQGQVIGTLRRAEIYDDVA